ncbi:MAG: hypothetical protein HFF79_03085 [Oscillospiraceae bacterium]|nr:hypothetical protein [Oscillospiraceae bacterium]MCI8877546.1 hypothetical protein [Oscillospiraceae bacterium]
MSDKTDFMELAPGETELRRVKGDCWGTPGRTGRQISGTFIFTDRRLLFQGGGLIASMRPAFSLPYGEVTRIENCTVGLFIPTGIRLYARGGGFYTISVMKRKEIAAFLQEKIQQ